MQACKEQPSVEGGHIVTITAQSLTNSLFYSGTIQPLKIVVIPSPADGVVIEMPFQYGEEVKSGQLLFMISSTKFLSDYKAALMQYIKAKSEFNTSQTQLAEADFLHKNQLISDDEYHTKKSNFYGSQLTLLQAKDALANLLQQLKVKEVNLYDLTITDIDKITQAMHLEKGSDNESLRIISPVAGVVLSAVKGEEENKKISKGDMVKQGDVLAIIGDLSGLSVRIKVNELTINQLKVGQKVKITGIAFPEDSLNGEIAEVDHQGESSGGGLPIFEVAIIVPHLTKAQQQLIHVGMSAKIEIGIEETSQITVPIAAVTEKEGIPYVNWYDEKNHQLKEIAVKTGKTTIDSVAILAGLKAGDKIVVPD